MHMWLDCPRQLKCDGYTHTYKCELTVLHDYQPCAKLLGNYCPYRCIRLWWAPLLTEYSWPSLLWPPKMAHCALVRCFECSNMIETHNQGFILGRGHWDFFPPRNLWCHSCLRSSGGGVHWCACTLCTHLHFPPPREKSCMKPWQLFVFYRTANIYIYLYIH